METKKSVLFLMNGFGLEVPRSFNIYKAALMPSLDKISNYYPFASVFASGTEVGLNKGQLSSFKAGYSVFSSFGKPNKKANVIQAKMDDTTFYTNPVISATINYALKNDSRLHVLFSIGERTEDSQFKQLKNFCLYASRKGVKQINIHVFLGDNSVKDMKVSSTFSKNLKYHVMTDIPNCRIVSIAGRKYLTDAGKDEKIAYYRMIVSGVGEVWSNYEDTIDKKYQAKENDDNMGAFLTVRENIIKSYDSVLMFNYDNELGAEYLDIIQHPEQYFPVGKFPLQIMINSLFEIDGNQNIPYGFESSLPDNYFFKDIPEDKKVLIIADQDRIGYISKCLNGFRTEFKSNLSVWPIADKTKRFDLMAQYLGAYIDQGTFDLIIADCDLFNDKVDKLTIDQLRQNMTAIDRCLNVAYTHSVAKDYTLYCTSLYGMKKELFLTKTNEQIDFSQKTPFIVAGKDITRANTSLPIDGNFTQVAQLLLNNMGVNKDDDKSNTSLVVNKDPGAKNKKIILVVGAVVLVFILFVVYALLYTSGVI